MKMFSPSTTAAATAALIQSTQNLSISSLSSSSPLSLPLPSSSSTLVSTHASKVVPKKLPEPRKKAPFRSSKRQQRREKASVSSPGPNSSSCGNSKERHPSVYVPARQDYMYNSDAWSDLSSIVWKSQRTKEIVLEWDEAIGQEERLVEIAKLAVDETEVWFKDGASDNSRMLRMLNLCSSMRCYVKHCRKHLTNIRSYKLKLSAMHGSNATRCPLWHADNVPLRWIQSYTGPGCMYMDEEAHKNNNGKVNPFLQRVRESDYDEEARRLGPDWKKKLVELSGVPTLGSPTGEPAMLVGRMWSTWSIEKEQQDTPLQGPMAGVLHRSPHNVPVDQERILLNLDVVCAYDSEDSEEEDDHCHDHSNCGGACQ